MKKLILSLVLLSAISTSATAQVRFGASRLAEGQIILASYLFGSACPGLTPNTGGVISALSSRGLNSTSVMEYPSNREVERLLSTFKADPATYCPKIDAMFGPLGSVAAGVLSPK
jgi:hypothetical protein